MTAGTPLMRRSPSPEPDAPVWERMRGAGAVLLGKLHMSEWAIGGTAQNVHYGPCRNPWDSDASAADPRAAPAPRSPRAWRWRRWEPTPAAPRVSPPRCAESRRCGPPAGRVSNRGTRAGGLDLRRDLPDGAPRRGCRAGAGGDRRLRPRGSRRRADVAGEDYVAALSRGAEGLRIGLLVGDWLARSRLTAVVDAVREAAAMLARIGCGGRGGRAARPGRGVRGDRRAGPGRGRVGAPGAAGRDSRDVRS